MVTRSAIKLLVGSIAFLSLSSWKDDPSFISKRIVRKSLAYLTGWMEARAFRRLPLVATGRVELQRPWNEVLDRDGDGA